jgi:hypothetical protein
MSSPFRYKPENINDLAKFVYQRMLTDSQLAPRFIFA